MLLFREGCVKVFGLIVIERASAVLWSFQALRALFRQGSMSFTISWRETSIEFSQQNHPLGIEPLWPAHISSGLMSHMVVCQGRLLHKGPWQTGLCNMPRSWCLSLYHQICWWCLLADPSCSLYTCIMIASWALLASVTLETLPWRGFSISTSCSTLSLLLYDSLPAAFSEAGTSCFINAHP